MKINFTIETDNLSGLKILDLDSPEFASQVIVPSMLEGIECLKGEGEYYRIPENFNGDLASVWEPENEITEFEALGFRRMMALYITPHVTLSVK